MNQKFDYSKYKTIKIDKVDQIAIVTLNRPEVLNAVNAEMHAELVSIFRDLAEDEEVRTVILTGAGRAFSAGGDIKWMLEMKHDPSSIMSSQYEAKQIIDGILNLKVPIIAAINGPAVGLGATIALFCDIIIASEEAQIGDPHVKMGIVAGDGGAVIWPLLIGIAKAKELLMTGELINAKEAERIGLINKVVPKEELMSTAMNLARRFTEGPGLAICWTKMVINKIVKQYVNLILDNSLALESITFLSEDHKEAVKAFIEKRKPKFNWM
ncbi:MAG: enoyl-CoA hydratase-related protein [Candidatus Bathyarchaeota archaeon]|nr:enoyl-CoA hydratase-related protein [Candidatus Bathyarchaeota archaeon]